MIIKTTHELRHYLPSHVLNNLETMSGFLDNSEHDFLAERIGLPLLECLNEKYAEIMEQNPAWSIEYINDPGYKHDVWQQLLILCQRCIVFDAFSRAADIHAISLNEAGLNIAESQGYDSAGDKIVDKYKAQLKREAHAASNRLLVTLEQWQKSLPGEDGAIDEEDDENDVNDEVKAENDAKQEIITLWKQSAYYYYADGLLFCTATEFGLYVNIYESREKFIQLLPDIRYCQETHIEAEIGTELLNDLIERHKSGSLNKEEDIAYKKLQRVLSLEVEARSKVILRKEAKDESIGHTRLTMEYIRRNQTKFDEEAMKASPLYNPLLWKQCHEDDQCDCESHQRPPHHHGHEKDKYLIDSMEHNHHHCKADHGDPRLHNHHHHDFPGDGMLVLSLI